MKPLPHPRPFAFVEKQHLPIKTPVFYSKKRNLSRKSGDVEVDIAAFALVKRGSACG
jgi:hypothetical protein